MVAHQVDTSGKCFTCEAETEESDLLQCYDCKVYYHAICGDAQFTPFGCKTFLGVFKKLKVNNLMFVCDICMIKKENKEASDMKDQIQSLTETVQNLVSEFETFKQDQSIQQAEPSQSTAVSSQGKWKEKGVLK